MYVDDKCPLRPGRIVGDGQSGVTFEATGERQPLAVQAFIGVFLWNVPVIQLTYLIKLSQISRMITGFSGNLAP